VGCVPRLRFGGGDGLGKALMRAGRSRPWKRAALKGSHRLRGWGWTMPTQKILEPDRKSTDGVMGRLQFFGFDGSVVEDALAGGTAGTSL